MTETKAPGEWRELGIFFGCNVLFAAGLFAHAFLYNFYLDALGVGEAVMGGAAAALTAGGLAALIPAGQVVDRLSARAAYLLAAVLAAAGLIAGAFVRSPLPIYAAAFVAGAGTATWRVSVGPLLMRMASPSARARAFSWNVALLLAAGSVWTAAAGVLPGWLERTLGAGPLAGLRSGLVGGALGTLLSGALFLLMRLGRGPSAGRAGPGPGDAEPSGTGAAATVPLRERIGIPRDLAVLVLIVAVWMTAGGLVIPFLNLFFLRVHGMEVARIGLLFAAAQAVTGLVVFASGDLAARFGPRRLLLAWALPFAPMLWALGGAPTLAAAAGLYLVQGFVPPATNPLIDQLLLERTPRSRHGAISTWRNTATELSGLIGAGLAGVLLEATSFRVLFGVAGAVALVGALGLTRFRADSRETTDAEAGPGRAGAA